ncbi:hypothetical protein IWW50_002136 [Coemansia erecta]|nr:hypothetical protein GGF43_003887 [Coemansia sp. RSA 2618]KAJ2826921.1 hypothetical protein IWW50_002136 [Coemansia erecta]
MLIDSALLQALEHIVCGSDGSATLLVLNDLDRALVIGGPTGEQLAWIHRAVDYIEQKSLWIQGVNRAAMDKCQASPNNILGADIAASLPVLCFPAKRYHAHEMDILRFQSMIIGSEPTSVPFIIEGAISFWPALTTRKWSSMEYLLQTVGSHRLVPVELGARYTDTGWSQTMMPFGQFLHTIACTPEGSDGECGYLAQHNLLDHVYKLRRDFVLPDYAFVETGRRSSGNHAADTDGVAVNVWLGPRGTVSPLHYDNYDNLFAQVAGCKYFRLFAPSESSNLYPHPRGSLLENTSRVDIESINLDTYPRVADTRYLECIVRPGDLLYIPVSTNI